MGAMASQITSLTIVYSTVYSGADQRKHQSPASLAFVLGIHREPVNSPHKWPVTRKMFPFDDVIMSWSETCLAKLGESYSKHINIDIWCAIYTFILSSLSWKATCLERPPNVVVASHRYLHYRPWRGLLCRRRDRRKGWRALSEAAAHWETHPPRPWWTPPLCRTGKWALKILHINTTIISKVIRCLRCFCANNTRQNFRSSMFCYC